MKRWCRRFTESWPSTAGPRRACYCTPQTPVRVETSKSCTAVVYPEQTSKKNITTPFPSLQPRPFSLLPQRQGHHVIMRGTGHAIHVSSTLLRSCGSRGSSHALSVRLHNGHGFSVGIYIVQ